MSGNSADIFALTGRVAVITGGAGLLGTQHAKAIARAGGHPILVDLQRERAEAVARELNSEYGVDAIGVACDITAPADVRSLLEMVLQRFGRIDILINNAANNPAFEKSEHIDFSRFENFSLEHWRRDIDVGLTGTFLCSQTIGSAMAQMRRGVIVNVASDLALIGPDQRIYREDGLAPHLQPVKPVSYSAVKAALIGLTRYLATYWAESGVRVNSISPGGVYNGQPDAFVTRLTNLIPLGRMANVDEYQGAMLFLCSDASSYMTGANLVVDGGRTAW